MFDQIKQKLVKLIAEDHGNQGEKAIDLIMITKYLERIGDHATNIAEWVEFSITGVHKGMSVYRKRIKENREMIYCVEDDGNIRELVVYTLNTTGMEVAAGFEDGKSFMEALAFETPELILLDIMLPGEDRIVAF